MCFPACTACCLTIAACDVFIASCVATCCAPAFFIDCLDCLKNLFESILSRIDFNSSSFIKIKDLSNNFINICV